MVEPASMTADQIAFAEGSSRQQAGEVTDHAGRWRYLGFALVLLLVPAMLLALPVPPTKFAAAIHKQDRVFVAAIVIACASLLLWWFRTPLFARKRSVLPLILLGTAVLLIANIQWNRSFTHYVSTHHYSREVFRKKARGTTYWPIYGRYDNAVARWDPARKHYSLATLPWVLVSCAIAGAWLIWIHFRRLDRRWTLGSFAVLLGLQLGLIVAFAACEPPAPKQHWPVRFTLQISGYREFAKDVSSFHGVRDTLRHYVQRMPDLQWYGQHYPPGNLILIEVEKMLGLPGFTKAIVVLMTMLSAIPLYLLGRELELDRIAISASLLLFCATTGVLVYCTINTTSLLLMPGTMCLWLLVRSMKSGSIPSAVALGVCFSIYLFFSFSASILGVLMGLTALLAWVGGAVRARDLVRIGIVALIALGAAIGALLLLTHFNLVACFITAVRGHEAQQGNGGFDNLTRYLLRSSGNIIAYLMSIIPLSILAGLAMTRGLRRDKNSEPRLAMAMFVALGLTVLLAGFSGLFYAETERIWIFLTPAFALAAGYELARRRSAEGAEIVYLVFLLVLAISCSQEFFFQHYR
jgi:hypothetical protein